MINKYLIACCMALISTCAVAEITDNVENPIYIPKAGEFYFKTYGGLMYKQSDDTIANRKKDHSEASEFPVWRINEDFGAGITDHLSVNAKFGYTFNGDIHRKGMHRGRIGVTGRVVESVDDVVWDVYGDVFLSGMSKMKAKYTEQGFDYLNFSNGRWGHVIGTRFGKTWWNCFTVSFFGEYLQTYGSHNNSIQIDMGMQPLKEHGAPYTMAQLAFPNEITVDLKRTHETNWGISTFYQMSESWSMGLGVEYNQHTDNGVKGIHTKIPKPTSPAMAELQQKIIDDLLNSTMDMDEGWDEYIVKFSIANQLTEMMQLATYAEYTFDSSHLNSQNGTNLKAELGFKINLRF